jgi:hypothetical protein
MRHGWLLLVLAAMAAGEEHDSSHAPLRNVEVTDCEGVTMQLAGCYRASGEDLFRGFLGSGEIQVPYDRIVEMRISPGSQPGGRMRAAITLRSGNVVDATFDEREGEQVLAGFASFGRATIFFRDVRHLRFLGLTRPEDLPDYGEPVEGLDVRITDREGVSSELIGFRPAVGENVLPGTRGAAAIAIPIRVITRLELSVTAPSPGIVAVATLRDGSKLDFKIPTYVEETAYRGEAEFGTYRIRLGELRTMIVHRATPELRDFVPPDEVDADSEAGEQPER